MKNNKQLVIVVAVALLALIGVVVWSNVFRLEGGSIAKVTSFEECVKAGYPVMESYPRQCRAPDGKTFVEQINSEQESGIRGAVLLGPTCPVVKEPPDEECADKPYETALVVTTPDQARVIKEFNSDVDGRFSVQVPPGEYAIRSSAAANVLPYCSTNDTVRVNINGYTETTVYCDTGIR